MIKNVKQIGTPREENRIYMENMVYSKIKEENHQDKKVFVLMGHTEKMGSRYATFVEAAIPVRRVEFSGNLPCWNSGVWSEVFREIKRFYEDMIIVGWSLELKGLSPKMTPELERIHREQFGGMHQLLFLLDSQEHEEAFYIYKDQELICKGGFYIYYKAQVEEKQEMRLFSEPQIEVEVSEREMRRGGRYRQMMQKETIDRKEGNLGMALAMAMLVFVLGVSLYENRERIFSQDGVVDASAGATEDSESQDEIQVEVIPGD